VAARKGDWGWASFSLILRLDLQLITHLSFAGSRGGVKGKCWLAPNQGHREFPSGKGITGREFPRIRGMFGLFSVVHLV